MPELIGLSHVDLSVRDPKASADWYTKVLGLEEVHRAERPERLVISLAHRPSHLVLGLVGHRDNSGDTFDEHTTGVDHVSFLVRDRNELDAWEAHLAALGVDHSPINEATIGSALVFRDPDNIQLEFWANRAAHS